MERTPKGLYSPEFRAEGVKLIEKTGLPRCRQKRKFTVTTDSRHNLPIAPNPPDRKFAVSVPNRAWVKDITHIATNEGWLYMAGVKDLFNGELVGYALDERMTQNLVMQALFRAISSKRPEKLLVHHSYRSSPCCSHADQGLRRQFGMQVSMSHEGNCWDNAPIDYYLGHSNTNWSTTVASPPALMQNVKSPSTSNFLQQKSQAGPPWLSVACRVYAKAL